MAVGLPDPVLLNLALALGGQRVWKCRGEGRAKWLPASGPPPQSREVGTRGVSLGLGTVPCHFCPTAHVSGLPGAGWWKGLLLLLEGGAETGRPSFHHPHPSPDVPGDLV